MTFSWLHRLALLSSLTTPIGCTTWQEGEPSCTRGHQRIDGHCLPTPSIVFQRCMEAFRTSSIEHDRGRELAVSASVKDRGGELQHERRDRERREYEGLATDDLTAVVGECRRQEEAERAGQIANAWEEAERARSDAERARIEAVGARSELQRAVTKLERLQQANARREAQEDSKFADLPTLGTDAPEPAPTDDALAYDATDELGSDEAP